MALVLVAAMLRLAVGAPDASFRRVRLFVFVAFFSCLSALALSRVPTGHDFEVALAVGLEEACVTGRRIFGRA